MKQIVVIQGNPDPNGGHFGAMQYRPRKAAGAIADGKSARIIVTMGMPSLLYRWLFRAHGVKTLERSILWWSDIGPIRQTLSVASAMQAHVGVSSGLIEFAFGEQVAVDETRTG